AFSLEILEAAKNGDGESQYYLFKVLDKCRWIFESERELTSIAQGLPILYSRIIEPTRTLCAGFDKDNLTLFNLSEKRMDSYRIKMQWVSMSAENGYAPAVINDWFDNRRSYGYDETIAKMRGVLESKHPDVYHFLSLMPNKEKHQKYAWQFLACDYGYDCSTTSLEFWKYDSLIDCNPINSSHRVCSEELDYLNTIKESLSEEELEKSLETKEWLKEMIESGQVEKIINS
ncbi:MAG: hypothetical protein OEY19_06100, partial [Gammaproteobacteria bacterium]|nr:hypothetical protein [Gammaproteobacteria bacterium]